MADILKWMFLNEIVWNSIKISLEFVTGGPVNNIPTLILLMVWRRPGDKPVSEPMVASFPTHICVTRPHWVKRLSGHNVTNDIINQAAQFRKDDVRKHELDKGGHSILEMNIPCLFNKK